MLNSEKWSQRRVRLKKKTETSEHDNLRRSRREVRKAWGKMLKWRRSQVRSCRRLVSCSYTTVTLKETQGGGGCFGTGAPGEVKDGGWQGGGKNTWNEENMGVKNTSCSQQAMSDRLLRHPHRKPPTLANTCNTCRGVCVSVWEQAVLYLYCLYYFVSCPCKNILQSGGIRLSLCPRGDTYCAINEL